MSMVMVRNTHTRRLQCLTDLGQALSRAVDLHTLFATLHRGVAASLSMDSFFLALYDEVSRTIEVVRQVERGTELPGGHFPIGEGVTSEAILTRRPRLIRQWSQEAPPV